MSGIGFWELILVFLIGLVVLGPERLPRVASQLGTWLGQARRMTRVMRRQLEEEINLEKETTIRPRRSSLPPPAPAPVEAREQPAEKPDDYSPAHDADAVGTGVETAVADKNDADIDDPASGDNDTDREQGGPAAQEKAT